MDSTRKSAFWSNPEELKAQEFDENEKIKRNGKEVSSQDYVQDFKDDCEIYTVLQKYGSVKEIPMDTLVMEGDISAIKDLRSIKDQEIRAQELWNNLPLNVRKEFGNNINEFRQNGEKWIKTKADAIRAEQEQQRIAEQQAQIEGEKARQKQESLNVK